MSMRFWPQREDIHPVPFLLYGLAWWLVGLIATFVIVGYEVYSDTTPDGRYVKVYNCTQAESDAGKTCTYQTAGTYFHQTVHDDAWIDGFIVSTIVVFSYGNHLLIRYVLHKHKNVEEE